MASGPLWLAAEGVEGAKPKRGGPIAKKRKQIGRVNWTDLA